MPSNIKKALLPAGLKEAAEIDVAKMQELEALLDWYVNQSPGALTDSGGAGQAGKILKANIDGYLDKSLLPRTIEDSEITIDGGLL